MVRTTLDPQTLEEISQRTLADYEGRAADFWEGTKDHDVLQNIQALLEALPPKERYDILDFGCGPGRDLAAFARLGHRAVGLEGCPAFCRMAREHSGCEVWRQDFLKLDLPTEGFDGIFANASLFHVPSQELPRVLRELWTGLRPGGVLFTSNPRGREEGWQGGRYGNFMEFDAYRGYLETAGFTVLHHYYRPAGKPRQEQPWLAVVSRK